MILLTGDRNHCGKHDNGNDNKYVRGLCLKKENGCMRRKKSGMKFNS